VIAPGSFAESSTMKRNESSILISPDSLLCLLVHVYRSSSPKLCLALTFDIRQAK
jgi:hypothetical protein